MSGLTLPRLSATLIVRNEASRLRRCLASILPFTDELVVVDTGSTDDSREVAASFGARVATFPWTGDFSAARNHALDLATGDWILYIDADECARPVDADLLRASLAAPDLVAAVVDFRNRSGVTRYHEHRLFRRDPRIRFRHLIHETIVPDIMARVDAGMRIGVSPLAIDHYGYDGDQSHKFTRNIPLLRERLAREPSHVYSWTHLGEMLAGAGDAAAARAAWQQAIALVRTQATRSAIDAMPYGALLLHDGDRASPDLLREARARFPHDLLLQWLDGVRLAREEQYEEAALCLEPLGAIDADTYCAPDGVAYDVRIFGVATWATLGLCRFQQGRYAESAAWYAKARAAAPSSVEYVAKHRLAAARAAAEGPA